ncbi:MAG: DUF883 domain-containing protein [Pseudomonadota bacterium]
MARKLAEVAATETTIQDLSAQLSTLKKDVSALTELLGDYTSTKGSHLADAAKEQFSSVREEGKAHAQAAAEKATEQITRVNDQAHAFVKNQPATAMGVAAGVGFLVGFMSGRK